MECVSAVAGECTKSAIVHVEREFGYLIHFTRSTNSLRDKIEQLTAIKTQVQELTGAALRNGELIKKTVEEWMTRADIVLSQATRLSDEASVIKGWFRGWCCGRFSLGRKAHKTIEDIQRVYDEGSGFGDNVSYLKPTQNLKLLGINGFNAFSSRDSTTEEIRKALLNDAINLVGVYGMPGVGKTALIKEIAKQVKENELFEEVVVVTVSQNLNLVKLQDDIAEGLDLKDLGADLSKRAKKLSDRLSKKTTLVILDDLWEEIDLFEVGIPYKNNKKCCKVVFTTRDEAVCDRMEANIKTEVVVLSKEDSWILFQQKSGNVVESSLAYDVLKECEGLPLAIKTLGLALRNKDTTFWKDALEQLRNSIFFEGMRPVNSSVISSIKLSYNFLRSKSLKICFLFCCLFPEDHEIELDILLSYVMGEKLVEDVETYDEARGRLYSRVDELVSSGLLLRDEEKKKIMMHDVVRDVAISIAREDEGHIVKAGMNQSYWPDMDLENCKRLSLMYNPIKLLPTIPIEAPHLQSLFLNNNHQLTELPSEFFAAMKSLKTLDLSNTYIESLPPSLSCLQSLHTLLLNNTKLKNLSPIEKLVRLEVLSLNGSGCWDNRVLEEEVVEQIGNLSNLRILDLTKASLSSSIRPDLFFKLRRLEKFHMLDRSIRMEFFPEIGSLSRLTSLEVQVFNPKLCNRDIPGPWLNLTTFRIAVDSEFVDWEVQSSHFSRVLFLHSMESFLKLFTSTNYYFEIKELANWVLVLLGRTNYLQVHGWPSLQSLTELAVAAEGMNENLESLRLVGCEKMGSVFTNTGLLESNQNVVFGNLEELRLVGMDALVEICQGTPPPRLLQKLKTLRFYGCKRLVTAIHCKLIQNLQNLERLEIVACFNLEHVVESVEGRIQISQPFLLPIFPNLKEIQLEWIPKIRYLFTMRVARNLLMLEQIQLPVCSEMEVLFKYEDGEDTQFNEDTAILPRLKLLNVRRAPQFKSFTNQNLVMELLSIEHLYLSGCQNLDRLPFHTTSVPNLKSLYMKQEVFARLEWEDESVKARFQAKLVPGYHDDDDE